MEEIMTANDSNGYRIDKAIVRQLQHSIQRNGKLTRALLAHHQLLEEIRTSGTMNVTQASQAITCLHLYNGAITYDPNTTK
jgi:hypothetical protein